MLIQEKGVHGTQLDYSYDKMDGLTTYNAGDLYHYDLTYDSLGRLIRRYLDDSLYIREQNYDYDGLSQLTQDDDKAYVYDSLYNAITRDGASYQVNDLNQLTHDGVN